MLCELSFSFTQGEDRSVQILKDALEEFGEVSGLWPNAAKSNVYYCKFQRTMGC